jgi:hypothetical protein
MAGGDTGAAHTYRLVAGPCLQRLRPAWAQLGGREQAPIRTQIPLAGMIDGTRDVARYRIERLGSPLKSLRRTGIDQQAGVRGQHAHELVCVNGHAGARMGDEPTGRPPWREIILGTAMGHPGLQAAVEYCRRVMPHPVQHPP